ncbi:YdcF family protein [Aquibium oceanicum]|uniref:DUF218 domain-containing protein n=1 Tax=Aquibium oceanicum TaxID=1670800 RepID=A0A1L3ST02_9HYPH|nr:YdcF family protein [Aquibium oceanicum]APH72500.1 hypothetical protein BSQ44_14880 [Aquibium oceanicum]
MFFIASKVFWAVANPLSLTALLVLAGILLAIGGFKRLSAMATGLALLVLGLSGWTTLGAVMLHPLEDRFARPAEMPERVDGIVVLGGGFEGGVNRARGGYELNSAADRFVETAILARRYPQATVLVSGGTGALLLKGEADAETAPRLLEALGVDGERLVLEGQSRDTYENAVFSRQLADPQEGETWLLVTSAFHMPRSVGLFREAGFPVVPWPADYRTAGDEGFGLARDNAFDSLQNTAIAMREWIGLIAYRLTGRTKVLLPAPG